MRTVDRLHIRADPERVFQLASDVEQWPRLLSHYRWVRMLERKSEGGVVEMAAWRPFGRFKYPTWWISEMRIDRGARAVYYRHIRGITAGMQVAWELEPAAGGTDVTLVHDWTGPGWPLVGKLAAEVVIGPVFVHGIASRTLAGIRKHAEVAGQGESGAAGQRGSEEAGRLKA
jgi:ribosome-associated toxin RatA of RatAB toxin-antitoxin module